MTRRRFHAIFGQNVLDSAGELVRTRNQIQIELPRSCAERNPTRSISDRPRLMLIEEQLFQSGPRSPLRHEIPPRPFGNAFVIETDAKSAAGSEPFGSRGNQLLMYRKVF